jgi:hypothetical protein
VATNAATDLWRRGGRGTRRSEPLTSESAITTDHGDGVALKQDMSRTFRDLKPRDRVLLWLAHVAGFASLVVFLVWQWKALTTLVARAIPAGLSAMSTAAPPGNPLVLALLVSGTAAVGAMVLAGLHRMLSRG